MFRKDTVVRLEPGVLLQNLTKANAAKVKRLRWSVQEEDWFPVTRDSRVDRRFWTLLQASFYETYQRRGQPQGEQTLESTLHTSEVYPGYLRWSRIDI